jgi:ABC-2 type transport system ATP-binding protein
MMKNVIEVRDLVVVRGEREVLPGISLDVWAGVTGLLGPSGCGKTTLMRSLVGAQQVRSGTVEVLGEPAGSVALRTRVGYVTQSARVYDYLTIAENLSFFARVLGTDRSSGEEAIDVVGLAAHRNDVVWKLSGVQRRVVCLPVALLGSPDLLVLDEPTVGLDPVLRRDLWELFHRLADGGAAVLVSSHVMDEAERCHRLLLMREGRIIADGSPDEIRARTGAPDIEQAFLHLVEQKGEAL